VPQAIHTRRLRLCRVIARSFIVAGSALARSARVRRRRGSGV